MIEVVVLISINILFFVIMKVIYKINPWEINKMIKHWNRKFGI